MYLFYLYHPDLKTKQRLKHDPVGWDSLGKEYKRETKWHGVFFTYTPRLQFVKDGRAFCHYFYEKHGPTTQITLTVYKKNRRTRHYDLHYHGRLNLMKAVTSTLYFTCNCEQIGFIQKFKNRQDVKVDMSVTTSQEGKTLSTINPISITLPSKVIRKRFLRDKQYRVVPDAWQSITSYGLGALVYYNLKNWKSLQAANLGNTPSEGAFWTEATLGETGLQLVQFDVDAAQTWYIKPSFDQTTLSLDEIETRQNYGLQATEIDPVEALKYDFVVQYGGAHTIDIDAKIRLILATGGGSGEFEMVLVYGKQGNYTEEVVDTTGPAWTFSNDLYLYDNAYTVNLQPNDEVYIFWRLTFSTGSPTNFIFLEDYVTFEEPISNFTSVISIQADTLYPDTALSLMLKHEIFARVAESITDTKACFTSSYYGRTDSAPKTYVADGEGGLRGIAPGKLVRSFPIESNHIYASFADLLEMAQAVDGVGVGIEVINNKQQVVVEKISHFYKNVRSAQIPYVRDIEKSVLDEFYFNELECGYEKFGDEAVGNLDETNARREYTLPISEIKKKLVLKSPYHASSYLIEQVRRESFSLSNTKDNKFDNDNFLFQLKRVTGGFAVEHNEPFESLANVISPETLINVRLSPMRNIIRNGSYIRSGLYHKDDEIIKLAFGEANTTMVSRLPGEDYSIFGAVFETSIPINKLAKSLWIPEAYTFKAPLTQELLEEIEADLYGYIEFAVDDKSWKKGYLLEMKPEPDSELTNFKLLRANL